MFGPLTSFYEPPQPRIVYDNPTVVERVSVWRLLRRGVQRAPETSSTIEHSRRNPVRSSARRDGPSASCTASSQRA